MPLGSAGLGSAGLAATGGSGLPVAPGPIFTVGDLIAEEPLSQDYISEWGLGLSGEIKRVFTESVSPYFFAGAHTCEAANGDLLIVDSDPARPVLRISAVDGSIIEWLPANTMARGFSEATWAARCDASDRLIVVVARERGTISNTYRFNPDGSLDTVMPGGPPNAFWAAGIHPDGTKIYAVTTSLGSYDLWWADLPGGWTNLASKAPAWTLTPSNLATGIGVHTDGVVLWAYEVQGISGNDADGWVITWTHFIDKIAADGTILAIWPLPELDITNILFSPVIANSGNGVWPVILGGRSGTFWAWLAKCAVSDFGTDYWLKVLQIDIAAGPETRYLYSDVAPAYVEPTPILTYESPTDVPTFPGLARFPSKDGAALWGPPL